mmetsp:Transcript_15588/g.23469  ORF Transcript_15588/g.23469 Transcript_15588/m.23469 type:complete len:107 (-) Transcript_15588:195-515(-)
MLKFLRPSVIFALMTSVPVHHSSIKHKKKGQNTRGTILCKHLLAVKIAPFVASLQVQEIRDQDFHATLAARSSLLGKGPPPPTKKNKGYGGGGGGEDNDDDRIFDR